MAKPDTSDRGVWRGEEASFAHFFETQVVACGTMDADVEANMVSAVDEESTHRKMAEASDIGRGNHDFVQQ